MEKDLWKEFIPKSEWHLYEDPNQSEIYLKNLSKKIEVNSPHDDLVKKLSSFDRNYINQLVCIGKLLDRNKIDGSKKFMLGFAMDNVPFEFKGSNKEYAKIISNFYAEKMANYLIEDFSLKEAHNSAIIDAYIKMFELKK